MKKMIVTLALASVFAVSLLSASVPMGKSHKGLKGLDGAKINCVYCHKKAGNPKTKGNDINKLTAGKYCKIKGCHPRPAK